MKKEVYKKISNIAIIIAIVILTPIFLMNLWIMFQAKNDPDKIPSIFGYKPFIVLSGSMETQIHKGDLIISKNVDPSTLKINDIIAYRDIEGTVTTHRIIDIVNNDGQNLFITKGDNNNTQDQNLVEYNDVEGVYVLRIPGVGSIMDGLSQPTTIIIILLAITLIFVIGFTISTKKQRELERQELLELKKLKLKEKEETKEENKKEEQDEKIDKTEKKESKEKSVQKKPQSKKKTSKKK